MNALIQNAHIVLLPTFQNTGIKLKLLESLFKDVYVSLIKQCFKIQIRRILPEANSPKIGSCHPKRAHGEKFSAAEINKRQKF